MLRRAAYRLALLGVTLLVIPAVPILIIYAGVSSPEYVIKGALNIQLSERGLPSYWDVYTGFLWRMLHCDFGHSTSWGMPATRVVLEGLAESMPVILTCAILTYLAGTALGAWRTKNLDAQAAWAGARFVVFVPAVILAYLGAYGLSHLGLLQSSARYLLAGVVLSVYPIYVVSRSFGSVIAATRNSSFFRCHQAMGFRPADIWLKFCWKAVVIDYLSSAVNLLVFMLGFLFFVEAPLGIDGMGRRFVMAVHRYDYPVVIGYCIVALIVIAIVGFFVDLVRARLDPRVENA